MTLNATFSRIVVPSSHFTCHYYSYVPTGTFVWKQTYPAPGSVPVPKPEWVAALDKTKIAAAPVVALSNGSPVNPTPGSDPYCDWTFGGCTRADDIFQCKKGDWGLTYDDGPTGFSPKLYDYLDSINQKATLFVIGGQVLQFPELVQRAYKAGHEIAIHGFSHSYLTSQTTEQIVGELRWTEEAIKEVIGVSPKLFRPVSFLMFTFMFTCFASFILNHPLPVFPCLALW